MPVSSDGAAPGPVTARRIESSVVEYPANLRPVRWSASYTLRMSAIRDELHFLVDQLPEERLVPVLRLIRGDDGAGRRERALAALARAQENMRGVTGADEELARLRDGDRG